MRDLERIIKANIGGIFGESNQIKMVYMLSNFLN